MKETGSGIIEVVSSVHTYTFGRLLTADLISQESTTFFRESHVLFITNPIFFLIKSNRGNAL